MHITLLLLLLSLSLLACDSKEAQQEGKEAPNGENQKNTQNNSQLEEHLKTVKSMRKPTITIQHQADLSINKIGGLPLVAEGFKWPEWQGKPMSFLLQINLEDIPLRNSFNPLPKTGLLAFYYDSEQSTWGFDPKDKGSWQIIYSETLDNLSPAKAPSSYTPLEETYVGFKLELGYPDWQDDRIYSLNFSDEESDAYNELRDSIYNNQSKHQLFGHASPIQNAGMDLKSQLASNGIYLGDGSGYNSDKAKLLELGRSDWRLLLQFDTDEELGIMWADSGMLYFWMKLEDIKNKKFDNAWMILQSY